MEEEVGGMYEPEATEKSCEMLSCGMIEPVKLQLAEVTVSSRPT